ncbi:ComGF family competence protein [Kurthia sibirica]|uniref:Competence protein ComG n=1 Tax=Kurthia sibirica TaxID=202750 RepID=A0A2U3ALY3_9BACL|nr:ComGF family competence protein [Kurthia sibirica]PWI25532.1 hypothetical protein DEX24_07955 [Kurthia sibirica]GEK33908.1 hypothetical protein KSI01_14410 [Kurthia sibirica]
MRYFQKMKNRHGFTVLEMLLQLAILLLLVTITPFLFPWYSKTQTLIFAHEATQYDMFIHDIRKELKHAVAIKPPIGNNPILVIVKKGNEQNKVLLAEYRYFNQKIISTSTTVGGTDIKVVGVKKFSFRYEAPYLKIYVEFSSNRKEMTELVIPFIDK